MAKVLTDLIYTFNRAGKLVTNTLAAIAEIDPLHVSDKLNAATEVVVRYSQDNQKFKLTLAVDGASITIQRPIDETQSVILASYQATPNLSIISTFNGGVVATDINGKAEWSNDENGAKREAVFEVLVNAYDRMTMALSKL